MTTASAVPIASRYVSGRNASPGSQSTFALQACERMCPGGVPVRVTHVTASPRRTASSTIADPTKPVPPNTIRRFAALFAADDISRVSSGQGRERAGE